MFTPKELTEQAFRLYQKITELSKKKGIRANQEKYFLGLASRSLSDNRYGCLIFCGAITQKKQDWACKTTSQITHS